MEKVIRLGQLVKSSRKLQISLLMILVVIALGLLYPQVANASAAADFIANVLTAIFYTVFWLFGNLCRLMIELIIIVSNYNGFIENEAVMVGWALVRDVCNMLFIIVLLTIAVSTILGIQSYSYRTLLGKFIIMVVLINFSKLIAGFFIDMSQVIMLTFVTAYKEVIAVSLFASGGFDKLMDWKVGDPPSDAASFGTLAAVILGIIMIVIMFLVLLVLFVILLVRIIMLWLLVIISPIAYLASTFPGGNKYTQQWWKMFGQYLVIGPVLAFFLWLTVMIIHQTKGNPSNSIIGDQAVTDVTIIDDTEDRAFAVTKITETGNFLSYGITIVLLVFSLTLAQQSGVIGSQLAGKAIGMIGKASAASLAPLKLARKGLGRGARAIEGKMMENKVTRLATRPFWHGVAERGDRVHARKQKVASGWGAQNMDAFMKHNRKAAVRYGEMAESEVKQEIMAERRKEAGDSTASKERNVEMMLRAKMAGGGQANDFELMASMMKTIAEGNGDDGLAGTIVSGYYGKEKLDELGIEYTQDEYVHDDDGNFFKTNGDIVIQDKEGFFVDGAGDRLKDADGNEINKVEKYNGLMDVQKKIEEKIGKELVVDINDISLRRYFMDMLDLNRGKFDPISILENSLKDKLGDNKGSATFKRYLHTDWDDLSDEDRKTVAPLKAEARKTSRTNARKANSRDRGMLRTLSEASEAARNVGHWEQAVARRDAKEGFDFLMDYDEMGYENIREANKRNSRQVKSGMAPLTMATGKIGSQSGRFSMSSDFAKMTPFLRRWYSGKITEQDARDAHHFQVRVAEEVLGMLGASVDLQDSHMYRNGNLVYRHKKVAVEEDEAEKIKAKLKTDGKSEEEIAKEINTNKSEEEHRQRYNSNNAAYRIFYNLAVHGDGRAGEATPLDPEFEEAQKKARLDAGSLPKKHQVKIDPEDVKAQFEALEKGGFDMSGLGDTIQDQIDAMTNAIGTDKGVKDISTDFLDGLRQTMQEFGQVIDALASAAKGISDKPAKHDMELLVKNLRTVKDGRLDRRLDAGNDIWTMRTWETLHMILAEVKKEKKKP